MVSSVTVRITAGGIAVGAALLADFNGYEAGALVAAGIAAVVFLPPLGRRISERWEVRNIAGRLTERRRPPEDCVRWTPRQCLAALGISSERKEALLEKHSHSPEETVLAELDHSNHLLSHVGEIPLYDSWTVSRDSFRPRTSNRTEIVLRDGVIAFKKRYADRDRFMNEVRALATLEEISRVPCLIDLDRSRRISYQSFIPGRNLGSLLADRGASVREQFLLEEEYPGPENWSGGQDPPSGRRAELLQALREIVDAEFLRDLGRLVREIHDHGVALRDIKPGNVLVHDGSPFLCDFDGSSVPVWEGRRFDRQCREDLDRLRYLFGIEVME